MYFSIALFFNKLQTFIIRFIKFISYCCLYSENSSNVLDRETSFWENTESFLGPHLIPWKIWDFTHLILPQLFQRKAAV